MVCSGHSKTTTVLAATELGQNLALEPLCIYRESISKNFVIMYTKVSTITWFSSQPAYQYSRLEPMITFQLSNASNSKKILISNNHEYLRNICEYSKERTR